MTTEIAKIKVLGRLTKEIQKKFKRVLQIESRKKNEVSLFVDFSIHDVPIGHSFKRIIDSKGGTLYDGNIILKKVSQQFMLPYEVIPHGHKTVCKFEFLDDTIPEALNKLSEINDWYDSNTFLKFE